MKTLHWVFGIERWFCFVLWLVYVKTKLEPWPTIIEKRHLKWFDKIAWMDPSTPTCSALHNALEEFRRPRGKPSRT